MKDIKLTDEDFKIISDALEFYIEKTSIGNVLGDMLFSAMDIKDQNKKAELESHINGIKAKKQIKQSKLEDDICLLKAKLLMLKRYMNENDLID